jgi:hypothetical protein
LKKDKGVSWEQEKLDKDADYLPTQNISMNVAGVLSAKDVENVMLLGTRDKALNDTVATTWLRTVDYDANVKTDSGTIWKSKKIKVERCLGWIR